ncbi:MAG TPA: ATP-binding cassette domain-containing protein [Solirubrobacteraceae bacterium]|nr:ATP-binding cassette domain-containing protein [Solirubrobacteraceae bacterium]
MQPERAIDVAGLVREFKGGVRAVDGIDLHVAAGEIYGFLGPNGAGKSTTVKVLTTLLPPTAGRALVAGHDVARAGAKVRASIGVALQDVALDPMLTGREHMRLQAGLHGIPRSQRATRGDELLERVGLSDAADRKSSTYSGGMRRRLDLALALLHSPRILFLDEPTTGLDVQSRTALWDEVARLARDEGTTVFLTTQYLEEADVLADRVGIIDRGTIVAEGPPATLKAQVSRPTVEVVPRDVAGCAAVAEALAPFGEKVSSGRAGSVAVRLDDGADRLADIVRALDAAGIPFANLALHEPTLDDVFLAKTGRSLEGSAEEVPEDPAPRDAARPERAAA